MSQAQVPRIEGALRDIFKYLFLKYFLYRRQRDAEPVTGQQAG